MRSNMENYNAFTQGAQDALINWVNANHDFR